MCESIPSGYLMHDESRELGIRQLIVSRSPGHLQTTKNLFRNILSSFPTALRVKGFKQSGTVTAFWSSWRAFIDHKRPIKAVKPFALSFLSRSDSFCDLFFTILLCWNSYFYQKWQPIILYIDRLDWGAGHLTILVGTGGGVFSNKNCPQGRTFDHLFQLPGVWPGVCIRGKLAAGIDSHFKFWAF